MILVWFVWVSLVLGGVAGALWYSETFRGTWLRVARVAVRKRPRSVWHRDADNSRFRRQAGGVLPAPRVRTRGAPPGSASGFGPAGPGRHDPADRPAGQEP